MLVQLIAWGARFRLRRGIRANKVSGVAVKTVVVATVAALCISLVACVLPPTTTAPAVIPKKELSLVSHMSQGRNFVAQGRYDLAEIEFRQALLLAPQLGSLYSDLGYVVVAQQRYTEAISFFEITLRFAPGDVSALTNLAATYYKMGDLEQSIGTYEALLAKHELREVTEFGEVGRKVLTALELVDIYRNLSIVHNLFGNYGEAVCWSAKAVEAVNDISQSSQHARLLLSIERTLDASDFLSKVIAEKKQQIPPELMLDFGAAALELGNSEIAGRALSQLAFFSGVSIADELDAQLLLALLAQRRGEDTSGLLFAVLESDSTICESGIAERRRYWPQSIVDDTVSLIRTYCDESRKSIFSPSKFFAS